MEPYTFAPGWIRVRGINVNDPTKPEHPFLVPVDQISAVAQGSHRKTGETITVLELVNDTHIFTRHKFDDVQSAIVAALGAKDAVHA